MKNVFVIAFLRRAWGAVPASAVGVAAAAALQQADVDVVVLGREAQDLVDHVQHRALGGEVGADFRATGRVHVKDAALAGRVKDDRHIELAPFGRPVDDIADGVGAFIGVLQAITPLAGPRRGRRGFRKEVDLLHRGSPDI